MVVWSSDAGQFMVDCIVVVVGACNTSKDIFIGLFPYSYLITILRTGSGLELSPLRAACWGLASSSENIGLLG